MNGYSTKRYRINTSYSEIPGSGNEVKHVDVVEEMWVTDALKDIPDPMEAFTRAFGGKNGMPTMSGSLNDLMRQRGDAQRRLFTGLPVKTVATTTMATAAARSSRRSPRPRSST